MIDKELTGGKETNKSKSIEERKKEKEARRALKLVHDTLHYEDEYEHFLNQYLGE